MRKSGIVNILRGGFGGRWDRKQGMVKEWSRVVKSSKMIEG